MAFLSWQDNMSARRRKQQFLCLAGVCCRATAERNSESKCSLALGLKDFTSANHVRLRHMAGSQVLPASNYPAPVPEADTCRSRSDTLRRSLPVVW